MEFTVKKQLFTSSKQPALGLSLIDDYPDASSILNTEQKESEKIQVKTKALHLALQQAGHKKGKAPIKFLAGKAPTTTSDWLLSLSHSCSWLYAGAIAAASDNKLAHIGIDIEQKKQRDFHRLGSFLGWQQPSVDAVHFYRRWTLTESLYKAISTKQEKKFLNCWFKMLDDKLLENINTTEAISIHNQGWYWQAEWPHFSENVITCAVYGLAPEMEL